MSCTNRLFQNLNGVDYNLNILHIVQGMSFTFIPTRPFIPIAILAPNPSIIESEIDIVNTKAYINIIQATFEDCLNASYNLLNEVGVPEIQYQDGNFGYYLSSGIGVNNLTARQYRYYEPVRLLKNFWDNYLGTLQDLYKGDLEKLTSQLIKSTDKNYWIPQGQYYIPDGGTSVMYTLLQDIAVAQGFSTDVYLMILELNSIG